MMRHRKRFITQDVSDYRMQIRLTIEDSALTELQRVQALNKIERDALRQYGFYSDGYRLARVMCIEAQKTLLTDAQRLTG